MLLLLALAQAESPWWRAVPWEQPLPEGLEAEHDWPWGAREGWDCGWQADTLLCAHEGQVREAWRRSEEPVAEGRPRILRTAGFEYSWGLESSSEMGQLLHRTWGSPVAPHRGWEGAVLRSEMNGVVGGKLIERNLRIEGEGADLLQTAGAQTCRGALVEQPIEVLFDDSGQARMLRVQGFPESPADFECLARYLLKTRLDEHERVSSIEATVTLLPRSAGAPP